MLFDIHSGCFGRFIRLVTSGKCLSIILVNHILIYFDRACVIFYILPMDNKHQVTSYI